MIKNWSLPRNVKEVIPSERSSRELQRSVCSNRKFSGLLEAELDHNKKKIKIMRDFNEALIVQQAIAGRKETAEPQMF